MRLGDLTADAENPRAHNPRNIGLIETSLNEVGAGRSIVIDENGKVLVGNGTLEAAARAGIDRVRVIDTDGKELVAVRRTGLTTRQKKRLAILDNAPNAPEANPQYWQIETLSKYKAADPSILLSVLSDSEYVKLLGRAIDGQDDDAQPLVDRKAELLRKWGVEPGDVWQIGRHRLVCGDSRDPKIIEALLAGERIGLVVTDAPYGVNYDSTWRAPYSTGEYAIGSIANDDISDWGPVYKLVNADVMYIWHSGLHSHEVAKGLLSAGYQLRSQIIWNKGVMVFGRGNYHWKHEPCWYVVKKGAKAKWIGDRSQHTVWDFPNNSGASRTGDEGDEVSGAVHISQKPVGLFERSILNHNADIVGDMFLGTGTAIVACERTGRHCRAVELMPDLCAVSLERVSALFGLTAQRVSALAQPSANGNGHRKPKGKAK